MLRWMTLFICSRKEWCIKSKRAIRLACGLLLFVLLHLSQLVFGQSVDKQLKPLLETSLMSRVGFKDKFEEDVWLMDMSIRLKPFIKKAEQRIELLKIIHKEATRSKLTPELVLAVIHTESAFDRYAVSSVGAQGLMQVMPFWKKEIGLFKDNLTVVGTNLRYGCTILSLYLTKEKGDLSRALARYNGSLGKSWYPKRVYKNLRTYWR